MYKYVHLLHYKQRILLHVSSTCHGRRQGILHRMSKKLHI